MRLLLDQGLPVSAASRLSAAGHLAEHVSSLGLSRATDEEILAEAVRRGAAIVTIDADFHAMLVLSAASMPSVVRLRIQGVGVEGIVALILSVISVCESELVAGAMVTADQKRARVRRLPLVP